MHIRRYGRVLRCRKTPACREWDEVVGSMVSNKSRGREFNSGGKSQLPDAAGHLLAQWIESQVEGSS